MKYLLLVFALALLVSATTFGQEYKVEGFCKNTYMNDQKIYLQPGQPLVCPGDGQAMTSILTDTDGKVEAVVCNTLRPVCDMEVVDLPKVGTKAQKWECNARPFPYFGEEGYQGSGPSLLTAMLEAEQNCWKASDVTCLVRPFSCKRVL